MMRMSNTIVSYNVFNNGDVYVGQMKNNKINGLGYFLCEDPPLKCEGEWSDGLLNGFGKQTGPESEKYTGEFVKGVKSGVGLFEAKKVVMSGNFREGEANGLCLVQDKERKLESSGSFKNGVLSGFGSVRSKDQEYSYFGNFKAGVFEGKGEETIRGNVYVGEFHLGLREGMGVFRDEGSSFVGYWVKGERKGFGIEKYRNKDLYQGYYNEDIKSGAGRYFHFGDGSTFVGGFEEGMRNGLGKVEFNDGGFYIGEWRTGKREGVGVEIGQGGRVYFGEWEKDRKQGKGYTIFGGMEYRGQWMNGRPHGRGVFVGEDQVEIAGVFENGVISRPRNDKDHRQYDFYEFDNYYHFLDKSNHKIQEIESQINKKIREIDDLKISYQEDMKLRKENLEQFMKELKNRTDNVLINCSSKIQILEKEVKNSKLFYLVEEWNDKFMSLFEKSAKKSPSKMVVDLKRGRSASKTPPKLAVSNNQSNSKAPKLRSNSKSPLKKDGKVAARKKEMEEINQRLNAIFRREFEEGENSVENEKESNSKQKSDSHEWDSKPLNKQTSTHSLDEMSDNNKLNSKRKEIEEKERLIFLEKMNVKKEKEEVIMLIEELQSLKAKKRSSKNDLFQSVVIFEEPSPDNPAEEPRAEERKGQVVDSQGDAEIDGNKEVNQESQEGVDPYKYIDSVAGNRKLQRVIEDVHEQENQNSQLEMVWKHYCIRPQKPKNGISLGDEESRILLYSKIDEVIMSAKNYIYRIKLNGDLPPKVVNMVSLEENQRVAHLFFLKGRYGAVLMPDFNIQLFDLLDRVYSNYKPDISPKNKHNLGRLA